MGVVGIPRAPETSSRFASDLFCLVLHALVFQRFFSIYTQIKVSQPKMIFF